MTFSVDTNIVIGVLNPKDRLHERSQNLVSTESRRRPLVPLITVIAETKKTFARKYNKAAGQIFSALSQADKEALTDAEYGRKTVKAVENLIKNNPKIEGFIKLIYDTEIQKNLPRRDLKIAFENVAAAGLAYTAAVGDLLKKEANNNTEYEITDGKEYLLIHKEIHDLTKGIYFKDQDDRLIFLEAVTYSQMTDKHLDHYTDDNECINQSKLGQEKIKANKKYTDNKLRILKLPPHRPTSLQEKKTR